MRLSRIRSRETCLTHGSRAVSSRTDVLLDTRGAKHLPAPWIFLLVLSDCRYSKLRCLCRECSLHGPRRASRMVLYSTQFDHPDRMLEGRPRVAGNCRANPIEDDSERPSGHHTVFAERQTGRIPSTYTSQESPRSRPWRDPRPKAGSLQVRRALAWSLDLTEALYRLPRHSFSAKNQASWHWMTRESRALGQVIEGAYSAFVVAMDR